MPPRSHWSHVFSPSLFNEVLHTHFGEVQTLRIAVLVLTVPVLYKLLGPRSPGSPGTSWPWPLWAAGAALGVGLLLTPGLGGHGRRAAIPWWERLLTSYTWPGLRSGSAGWCSWPCSSFPAFLTASVQPACGMWPDGSRRTASAPWPWW